MHETYANTVIEGLAHEAGLSAEDINEAALHSVIAYLNERYATCPTWKPMEEWTLERQILLTSFIGYLWYWQNDPVEFLASEVAFDIPVINPVVGLPLPMTDVKQVGKIDHVVSWQNIVGPLERKSTTRSIAPDSDYWNKGKKDTQVSMYAAALRDMQKNGRLPTDIAGDIRYVKAQGFGNTLYDVWHKPTIKPKDLTQKDTAQFLVDGKYFGQDFQVAVTLHPDPSEENKHLVSVDGESCAVEMGKKGFAIKESVGMYGARLLNDIYERPDFYFQRKEIARTEAELAKFRIEGYNIYQTQRNMDKTGHFFENEDACQATYNCAYIPICYGPGADAVCDGKTTPQGFKRIFVDLTVNGHEVEE